jgi:hypothetical protein
MNLDLEVYDPGDGMWATPNNLMTLTVAAKQHHTYR